ncbi:hypothetical protein BYT27DRAFT_7180621 [Phlegmacium glaucopus]|nr:hypothetical protein BYT27DRAFT_7180621 [Phlegmacium glaucopus]
MKRGAESQLTRKEVEEGYVEPEQTPDTGFHKAPEAVLKTRAIRGLPNRTRPSSAQSNSTNGTSASPLFPPSVASPGSTFTFNSPAAPTNGFATPAAHSSDSISSSSSSSFAAQTTPFGFSPQTSFPFSSTSQTNTPPKTTFAFTPSSDTSSAPSSTSKAFASVLNKSNSNIFGSPAPSNPSSSSKQPATADGDDPVLFKYYIDLRGLNHSLLSAISKGVEDDPFADMSGILESYKSMRLRIQKEKDGASLPSSSNSSSSSSSFFSMPAAASPFGKPTAQGAQSSFSTSGISSTPSTPSTSIFSPPDVGAQPNPFGFSSSTASKTFNSSNETPTQSVFSFSSQTPSFKPPEQTSSTTTTSLFAPTSSPFKFGGSTTNLPFGSSKPSSTFKWGATADRHTTGDLIGASANSSTTPSTPTPAASSTVHFQFGSGSSGNAQSKSKTVDEKTTDDAADGEESEQATPTTEGAGESGGSVSSLLSVHNPHDDEGEGEENESTVHAIKVKAYRMRKADAKDGPGWADLGFGILRLKKDNNTSARRMLLRNSTNGKILINFKIYSGLKPSLAKKALTFVGHDNGVSQTYCVRLPGEEQAQQLKDALDQEIESVTTKDKE